MATTIATTNSGKALGASQIAGTTSTPPKYIGVGTGTHTAAVTDTALTTPEGSRVGTNVPTITTTNVPNDTVSVVQTFTATGAVNLKEAGLFTAASGGTMMVSATFDGVALEAGEDLTLTFKTIVG